MSTVKKSWLKTLKIDPLPVLIEQAPLPVSYSAAKSFLPRNTDLLERLGQNLIHYKPRVKLLNAQQPDGQWKLSTHFTVEEHQKAMLFLRQLQNMTELLHYGCTREMVPIQKGLIALLKNQKPDGKFPLLFHHQGQVLWLLARYGLAGNPFVEKGYRWLAKRQRPDGGWLSPSTVSSGKTLNNVRSSVWTTVIITQAFTNHSRHRKSTHTERSAQFLLENYLQSDTTALFPEPDAWNYLYNDFTDNGLFRGGTLRFLEALAPMSAVHAHPNFRKALDWLIDQQLPNGLFPHISGKDQQGSYEVTLRVMQVLNEIDHQKK